MRVGRARLLSQPAKLVPCIALEQDRGSRLERLRDAPCALEELELIGNGLRVFYFVDTHQHTIERVIKVMEFTAAHASALVHERINLLSVR